MLDKIYDPSLVEQRIYEKWQDNNAFQTKVDVNKEPYCIMMPPPNVTGKLHVGHALTFTIQDMLIRYHRLNGKDVLWQAGTDHAGIATQMLVERQLEAEGSSRKDLGRDAFIDRVWQWKEQYGSEIVSQLKRLGCSADWSRERFTLDEGLSDAVRKVFVSLYNDGLIYRDKRLVNWDKKLQTAISDLEVEQKEVASYMWYFNYPIEDSDEFITIATTRPETMLADTAIAVHPEDERYTHLKGKFAILPIMNTRIPIVFDEYADPEKGTGAVKITPAHDFNDFEVGKRHNLPVINIFTNEIKLNENAPADMVGLDANEARVEVENRMRSLGLLHSIEDYKLMQPHGDRSGVVIEPWLMDQWFVDAPKLSTKALQAVENDITKFIPKQWENTYFDWMRNIQPWCVSRQLWWGHQIPVWYDEDGNDYCAESYEEALEIAREKTGNHAVVLKQDSDVLDTWFSSALWPFSTLGWPENTEELKRYYPSNVLVTGFDIIFFWVARMMMMGIHFINDVPFKDIYIHALVRDEFGQKMSKSKGNVLDPLELMDKFGTDAMRFTLLALASQGRDIRISESVIENYRNFITKVWNVSRFYEMNGCYLDENFNVAKVELDVNKWIVSKVRTVIDKVSQNVEDYRFNEAALSIYHFVWDEFCQLYTELVKPILYGDNDSEKEEVKKLSAWVINNILHILHPFTPFVTEEIANRLFNSDDFIMLSEWPNTNSFPAMDNEAIENMELLIQIVSKVRMLKNELNIKPSAHVTIYLNGVSDETQKWLTNQQHMFSRMAFIDGFVFNEAELPKGIVQDIIGKYNIGVPVADLIDFDVEIARLDKEIIKLDEDVLFLKKKLDNSNFVEKAPAKVIEEYRAKMRNALSAKDRLSTALEKIKNMQAK